MLRLSKTRWLSMNDVVQRIVEQWDALLSYFALSSQEDHNETATNILTAMRNPVTKAYFLFLAFFLPTVVELNLIFQSSKYTLHNLLFCIGAKLKSVLKYFMNPSYVNSSNLENINPNNNSEYLKIENIYLGARVHAFTLGLQNNETYKNDITQFKVKCLSFYVEFSNQVLKRINFKDPVLKNLSLLSPENCKSDEFNSIIPLAINFPNLIEEGMFENLDREWRLIKEIDHFSKEKNIIEFWNDVFSMKDECNDIMFPVISKFVKAMFCLPHSSATTERVFSSINLNKNKLRNRLTTPMINGLLLTKEKLKHSSAADFIISKHLIELAKKSKPH